MTWRHRIALMVFVYSAMQYLGQSRWDSLKIAAREACRTKLYDLIF